MEQIKRNVPRDVFLHLLAMVTLYWSAISFITLCWQYIHYFFPDALQGYEYMGFAGPIRFAVASLIIVFPVFILVSWFLNKIYRSESAVRESKIRKWLIYLTLFVSSLVIIGDLIYVVNTFLGGEITTRFILKALAVLVVAVVIFWYYLDDVRRKEPSKWAKYVAIDCAIMALIAVVGAFFIIGSPINARKAQFDSQRVGDLQNIQWQIVSYWQRKQALPAALSDLADPISSYAVPSDPETKQSYEYVVKDSNALAFELCATFSLENKGQTNTPKTPYSVDSFFSQNWGHPAGRYCFERKIDRELYPPFDKK